MEKSKLTYEEYIDRTHEIINEISDICNTTIVTSKMDRNEAIKVFYETLQKIDNVAVYPEVKKE